MMSVSGKELVLTMNSVSTVMRALTRKSLCAWVVTFCLIIGQGICDECKQSQSGDHKYCQCTTNSGFVIDLSQIVQQTPRDNPVFKDMKVKSGSTDTNLYSYQPCEQFTEGGGTNFCKDVAACQKVDELNSYSLGPQSSAIFTGDPSKNELNLTYQDLHVPTQRKTFVMLRCSKDLGRLDVLGETASGSLNYEFILHTKLVCMPSGGLSVGSILVIIFFVLVFVYLVGGILVLRYQHGARGLEQIPNYDFWLDFPSLVKDGFVFVKNGCKADGGYSQI